MRRSQRIPTLPLFLGIVLIASQALAADFTGRVVGVADGDTITVLSKGTPVRIRLHGIDCPEKRQGFGKRAKQFTSRLTYGKQVTVKDLGEDRYGRTIADVILPDGRVLNHELVKAGFAWWYRKYAPEDDTLKQLEHEARQARRGLLGRTTCSVRPFKACVRWPPEVIGFQQSAWLLIPCGSREITKHCLLVLQK